MKGQGRILVVDDSPKWCDQLYQTLSRNNFYVDSAQSIIDAKKLLASHIYHLIILDIRMDDSDLQNVDGMDFLDELLSYGIGSTFGVIMLSGYGTKEQMRESFRKYGVYDFVDKHKFDNIEFTKLVEVYFEKISKINFGLDIHWHSDNNPENAIFNLLFKNERIKKDHPYFAIICAELHDLLMRLFYDSTCIIVQDIYKGLSGTCVLKIQPFFESGKGQTVIVKFGDISNIEKEASNFQNYVQNFVGGNRSTVINDKRRTLNLGGINYTFLGINDQDFETFGTYYEKNSIKIINNVLLKLFHENCANWYANIGKLKPVNLTEEYTAAYNFDTKKLKLAFERLKRVQGKKFIYFDSLNDRVKYINPINYLTEKTFIKPSYRCITHGDLNQSNIFIDNNGNTWLIDFYKTGDSHIFRDLAELESVIRFSLLKEEESSLAERSIMENKLCSLKSFKEIENIEKSLNSNNQALKKAYRTALNIRKIARKIIDHNPSSDISEYYIALLYSAINTIRFQSLPAIQREHALLSASLIIEKSGI